MYCDDVSIKPKPQKCRKKSAKSIFFSVVVSYSNQIHNHFSKNYTIDDDSRFLNFFLLYCYEFASVVQNYGGREYSIISYFFLKFVHTRISNERINQIEFFMGCF